MTPGRRPIPELLASLPQFTDTVAPWAIAGNLPDTSCVVVLDDDPTGTQTVHDLEVVTAWDVETLAGAFDRADRAFYVLTNTRALPEMEAVRLTREIATNLKLALSRTRRWASFTLVSRGDSTLRGHFPAETDALADTCGPFDAVVLVPFFEAGGRITAGNTHYLRDGDFYVPVGESVYARDPAFGYQSSDLPAWVEEKTRGRISASSVVTLSLDLLRSPGAVVAVSKLAQAWSGGVTVVVNAADRRDLEVATAGLILSEQSGKRFLYRTAASFAAARARITTRAPLSRDDLQARLPQSSTGGLVVVGSFVATTTKQVHALLASGLCEPVEVSVAALLSDERDGEIARVLAAVDASIRSGRQVLVYTSRELVTGGGGDASLAIGRRVSDALVELVRRLPVAPRWLLAKGGITSSDLATAGLGVKVAHVVGQILPGVPVWRVGAETRWPGALYIVFPGNVGGPDALVEAVKKLI
ncbi:four-carbon acid sugar kinase family protein [Nibricoccus sp. IMCC34717]|uniref:four-carbon acid sugar kinase family protein n=1 Tax=Nibricoccus sp. IMCC34717 TaxID=3034021 RepID=UPI00384E165A